MYKVLHPLVHDLPEDPFPVLPYPVRTTEIFGEAIQFKTSRTVF